MMRTVVALFSLTVAAAVVGTLLLRAESSEAAAPSPAVASDIASDPSIAESPQQSSPGEVTDLTGATEAAVRAVSMTDELVTAGHFSRRDLIRSIATEGFAQTLIDDASTSIVDFQFEVNTEDGFWLVQQPLTAEAEALSSDRVRVTVWSVVVLASSEFGVGRETWQTSTLEMVAVDGAWLVDGWLTTPGPAPAPSPDLMFASPVELGEAMSRPRVGASE